MSKIVRFRKSLTGPVVVPTMRGLTIGPVAGPEDLAAWLELRESSFAGRVAKGRGWTADDYDREFAGKRVWLVRSDVDVSRPAAETVGSIALGRAGRPPHDRASLQWLMVARAFRRRGIGRMLIAAVEQAAWEAAERELVLETHTAWNDALRLYEHCGYVRIG